MADESVIVKEQGTIFLGGPPLVKAATGKAYQDAEEERSRRAKRRESRGKEKKKKRRSGDARSRRSYLIPLFFL